MQKRIDELHPFSRYTIELVAVVRQGNRNSALKRELEVNIGRRKRLQTILSPGDQPSRAADIEGEQLGGGGARGDQVGVQLDADSS